MGDIHHMLNQETHKDTNHEKLTLRQILQTHLEYLVFVKHDKRRKCINSYSYLRDCVIQVSFSFWRHSTFLSSGRKEGTWMEGDDDDKSEPISYKGTVSSLIDCLFIPPERTRRERRVNSEGLKNWRTEGNRELGEMIEKGGERKHRKASHPSPFSSLLFHAQLTSCSLLHALLFLPHLSAFVFGLCMSLIIEYAWKGKSEKRLYSPSSLCSLLKRGEENTIWQLIPGLPDDSDSRWIDFIARVSISSLFLRTIWLCSFSLFRTWFILSSLSGRSLCIRVLLIHSFIHSFPPTMSSLSLRHKTNYPLPWRRLMLLSSLCVQSRSTTFYLVLLCTVLTWRQIGSSWKWCVCALYPKYSSIIMFKEGKKEMKMKMEWLTS